MKENEQRTWVKSREIQQRELHLIYPNQNSETILRDVKKEVAPVDKLSTSQNPLGGLRTHLSQSRTHKEPFLAQISNCLNRFITILQKADYLLETCCANSCQACEREKADALHVLNFSQLRKYYCASNWLKTAEAWNIILQTLVFRGREPAAKEIRRLRWRLQFSSLFYTVFEGWKTQFEFSSLIKCTTRKKKLLLFISFPNT